jgi:hypothetical protein
VRAADTGVCVTLLKGRGARGVVRLRSLSP